MSEPAVTKPMNNFTMARDRLQAQTTLLGRYASTAETVVEAGMVSMEQMGLSQEMARRERLPLARVLIREGLVRSRDLAALLAMCLGLPMVDLGTTTIDPDAVAVFPEEIARRYHVLPVKQEDGRLVVAMVDPGDFQAVDDLSVRAGGSIRPVIATSEDILEHIDVSYRLIENLKEGPEHRTGEGS